MIHRTALIMVVMAMYMMCIMYSNMYLLSSNMPLNELGRMPQIPLSRGEELYPGDWVVCNGVKYDIWDVRNMFDRKLIFMVVSNPENGMIIKDIDVIARACAVRLAIEIGKTVEELSEIGKGAELISKLDSVLNKVMMLAEFNRELSKELKQFKNLIHKRPGIINMAELFGSLEEKARSLINERSDKAAEAFLRELVSEACNKMLSRKMTVAMLIIKCSGIFSTSVENWISSLLEVEISRYTPLLDLLANTYGFAEAKNTLNHISRGM